MSDEHDYERDPQWQEIAKLLARNELQCEPEQIDSLVKDISAYAVAYGTRERQLVALWLNSLAGETVDPLEVARMVLNGVHAVGEL